MTADLREALEALGVEREKNRQCPMSRLLDSLDKETRLVVEEKTFDPEFPFTRLTAELRRAGFKIAATSVGDHRKGACVCRSN